MAAPTPLNKKLWTELSKIKNFTVDENLSKGKFFYENSSFDHSQEGLSREFAQNVIIGRLWLTSDIYKNHALRIGIYLPPIYPAEPPKVMIETPIYHPKVNEKNILCDDRIAQTDTWKNSTTLMEVLAIIVDALDNPSTDRPANIDAGSDFDQNQDQYKRKAMEMVQKNGLPRS